MNAATCSEGHANHTLAPTEEIPANSLAPKHHFGRENCEQTLKRCRRGGVELDQSESVKQAGESEHTRTGHVHVRANDHGDENGTDVIHALSSACMHCSANVGASENTRTDSKMDHGHVDCGLHTYKDGCLHAQVDCSNDVNLEGVGGASKRADLNPELDEAPSWDDRDRHGGQAYHGVRSYAHDADCMSTNRARNASALACVCQVQPDGHVRTARDGSDSGNGTSCDADEDLVAVDWALCAERVYE